MIQTENMDWSLCAICQTKLPEPCKCPLDSLQEGSGLEAYSSFFQNVLLFREHNAMPVELKFALEENVESFVQNRARWHKSCRIKFANSKLERVIEKKRKQSVDINDDRRKSKRVSLPSKELCFFCGCKGNENLHLVTSLSVDENVKMMATELQATVLLAKLARGDMIATDSMYHLKCMNAFRSKYKSSIRRRNANQESEQEQVAEARAFAELVSYIESSVENGKNIFQLSEIYDLYVSRLKDLNVTKNINKTRLKNYILAHFAGEIHEQSIGRHTVLAFKEGIKSLLKDAVNSNDLEQETLDYAKVSKIIRNNIFEGQTFQFSGNFPPGCQNDSVPSSLLCLVSMLLNGPNITDQDTEVSQACLTIAQLIVFNAKKSASPVNKKSRHSHEREPPLPIYIGLNVHAQTRSRKLVDNLYHMGLSVSYSRIDELANGLATAVCNKFKADGVVCPVSLRSGLFTVGALDNLDHNPSSTTAQGSFHGTGISVFQFPTETNHGIPRAGISLPANKSEKKDFTLPDNFTTVPALSLKTTDVSVPATERTLDDMPELVTSAKLQGKCWAEHGIEKLNGDLSQEDCISWAAYQASLLPSPNDHQPAVSGLLPLFHEKAATTPMVKHGMDVLRQVTDYVNPGQFPVITLDQPLYTIAKYVQWKWPATHGEKVYVVMLGGLHIEMALWSLCGDMLESSGWTTALSEAGVASSGTADSFLKVSHLTRTRHAHQVTALALSKLQRDAFVTCNDESDDEAFAKWRSDLLERSPTLIFIKAHRTRQFQLFVETLEVLAPWFFALDHVNYSRWLPVFINDMKSLPEDVKEELPKNWVVQKTEKNFSVMPIDQAHEQNNAIVKGTGGAVGLTENPVAFARWMVAGPEMARLLKEFEINFLKEKECENYLHHEQSLSTQKTFQKQVLNLVETINEMGNPFKDDFKELVALDTRNCANESVITTVNALEEVGTSRYQSYVKEVIKERTTSIHDPIKKSSLALFKRQTPKVDSKSSKQFNALKSDRSLFSRLYIASQHRDGDLEDFFRHENQQYPPSLSDFGKLRFGKKSDLLSCLESQQQPSPPSTFDTKVFDGAVIVHALPVLPATTFAEYADKVFLPYINSQLQTCDRIDVVWDDYRPASLKEAVREKRGKGARKKVSEQTKLPRNWNNFLHDPANKQELFTLLSKKVQHFQYPEDKVVVITNGEQVLSSSHQMQRCNHEEADTRILVHVSDALKTGAKTISVRTVDTDVAVILIGHYHDLCDAYGSFDLWIAFGMGKSYRWLHISRICNTLGEQRCRSLPVFHSFTGCDTTSSFLGKGKKTAWEAWKSLPDVTNAFLYIKVRYIIHKIYT